MWDWDLRSDRLVCNERWAGMLGYQLDELEQHISAWRALIHPDDREGVEVAIARHLSGRSEFYQSEHRLRARNGSWIWVLDRGRVVARGARQDPLRMTGTHLDISERKNNEAERFRLESDMQHAQKLESLGVLAGGIAHDFNNLLTGVLGHVSLARLSLEEGGSPARNLDGIERASQRAAELCRQMLAYSGKGCFVVEPLRLEAEVRDMADLLEVSISKRVSLRCHFAEGLPRIEADRSQIQQVVMNLVTNASEAMDERGGEVTITTGLMDCDAQYLRQTHPHRELPEGPYVFLEVSDQGCGMSSEQLARIFDPFYTTKFTGRGLGLSAVLGIVRGHGGALRITSELGKGSSFTVLLPPLGDQGLASSGLLRSIQTGGDWRGSGRVLIVDDDPVIRTTAGGMLTQLGFAVESVSNGREAIDRIRATDFDLVLLDLTMPVMDGVECFGELRRLRPGLKVLLSSGYSQQDATQHFAGKELAGFVQKPYTFEALRNHVRAVFEA
jgi:PAS domain S-box-containing protein